MAAVVVVLLCVVLIWYFKHRRRETSRRGRPPVLASAPNSPTSNAHPDFGIAPTQGAFSSRFYAPSDVASQQTQQTSQPSEPPRVVFSHKAIYDLNRSGSRSSGTSHIPSDASTTPHPPPAGTNLITTPSGPSAQRDSRVNEKEKSSSGWPRYQVQNPTTPGALPGGFYSKAMADGEPVEAGLMSRHLSTRSLPPLYSPGGFRPDETAPPVPEK